MAVTRAGISLVQSSSLSNSSFDASSNSMIAIAQKNSNLQIKLGFNSSLLEEYFTDNLGKGNGEAKISFLHFLLPSLSYHVYILMLTIIRFTYFQQFKFTSISRISYPAGIFENYFFPVAKPKPVWYHKI